MAETSKLLYSGLMNRWLFGDSTLNGIFNDGFDDPTYLTFKIEFGDWGASILGRDIISSSTTIFRAGLSDYDELPIGLLNAPSAINNSQDNLYFQTNAANDASVFNNADIYSAFAYLRSRNEDTRAEYLFYFVNGLYEIQLDFPFLFKKISGLDLLEQFDSKQGQRLKNAKITISCFESLALKIRTLMELYRKAAWDDVYQRWILPENMREFKMIIYIFERRVFHDAIVNKDTVGKPMMLKYSDINADMPVKAFECCPCEFNIKPNWRGDYDALFNNGNEEETTIEITVKNVRTYYKNRLMNNKLHNIYLNKAGQSIDDKIDTIMIYDLVNSIDRQNTVGVTLNDSGDAASKISSATLSGVRQLFLNKNILLENEENQLQYYIHGFPHDATTTRVIENDNQQSPYNSINDYGKNTITKLNAELSGLSNFGIIEQNSKPRAKWMITLLESPSWNPAKSFWSNLGDNTMNLLTGARRHVLLSGNTNLYGDSLMADFLNWILPEETNMPEMISVATQFNQVHKITIDGSYNKNAEVTVDIENTRLVNNDNVGSAELEGRTYDILNSLVKQFNIDDSRIKGIEDSKDKVDSLGFGNSNNSLDIQPIDIDDTRLKDDYDFITVEQNRNIPDLRFPNINNERNIIDQQYQEIEQPRDKVGMNNNDIDDEREHIDMTNVDIDKERKPRDLEYSDIDKQREIPNTHYISVDTPREIPEGTEIDFDGEREKTDISPIDEPEERELVDIQKTELMQSREIPDMSDAVLDPTRVIANYLNQISFELKENIKLTKVSIDDEREKKLSMDTILMLARTIPSFSDMQIDDIRLIPQETLQSILDIPEKVVPNLITGLVEMIEYLSKATTKMNTNFQLIEDTNRKFEDSIISGLKSNSVLFEIQNVETNNLDIKVKQAFKDFAKIFAENSDEIHHALEENVINLKNTLYAISEDSIRLFPKLLNPAIDETLSIHIPVMMSEMDERLILKNVKLVGISEDSIRLLSFTSLISLLNNLEREVLNTLALQGISETIQNARKVNNKIKKQLVEKKKSKKKAMHANIDAPREVNNTIIY